MEVQVSEENRIEVGAVAEASGAEPTAEPKVAEAAFVDEEIDAGGRLEVLDPTGHFEVKWGRKKSEVEIAEATFNDLLSKGYLAFKKTWRGRKGVEMREFDPKAGEAIFEAAEKAVEPKKLPVAEKAAKKAEVVDDDGERSYEQTKKFDKKAETTMTPPMRGG
jgi:hypothetical protein